MKPKNGERFRGSHTRAFFSRENCPFFIPCNAITRNLFRKRCAESDRFCRKILNGQLFLLGRYLPVWKSFVVGLSRQKKVKIIRSFVDIRLSQENAYTSLTPTNGINRDESLPEPCLLMRTSAMGRWWVTDAPFMYVLIRWFTVSKSKHKTNWKQRIERYLGSFYSTILRKCWSTPFY